MNLAAAIIQAVRKSAPTSPLGVLEPAQLPKPRGHVHDETRSAEWNAWRDRQSLHPVPQYGPVRPAPPKQQRTAAELRARRLSTRSSRRRAAKRQAAA